MRAISKLGTTRAGERTRVWIEGKRLAAVGFTQGTLFRKVWADGELPLIAIDAVAADKWPRSERGTVSGKHGSPIIDVTGARVAATFSGTHVVVTFRPGLIVILDGDANA